MLFIMNDVEKRRLKLLQETRRNYSDNYSPPAVHPRFQSTYHSIYGRSESEYVENRGSFLIRCIIAALLFALFFMMDYRNEKIGTVDSQIVISEVQKNLLGEWFPCFIKRFQFFHDVSFLTGKFLTFYTVRKYFRIGHFDVDLAISFF